MAPDDNVLTQCSAMLHGWLERGACFAMVLHGRAGADSPWRGLDPELVRMIYKELKRVRVSEYLERAGPLWRVRVAVDPRFYYPIGFEGVWQNRGVLMKQRVCCELVRVSGQPVLEVFVGQAALGPMPAGVDFCVGTDGERLRWRVDVRLAEIAVGWEGGGCGIEEGTMEVETNGPRFASNYGHRLSGWLRSAGTEVKLEISGLITLLVSFEREAAAAVAYKTRRTSTEEFFAKVDAGV